jgi:hypothetical protein
MDSGEGCPPEREARRWAFQLTERATVGKPTNKSPRRSGFAALSRIADNSHSRDAFRSQSLRDPGTDHAELRMEQSGVFGVVRAVPERATGFEASLLVVVTVCRSLTTSE